MGRQVVLVDGPRHERRVIELDDADRLNGDRMAEGGDLVVERGDVDGREREVDGEAAGELDHVEVAVAELILEARIGEPGVAALAVAEGVVEDAADEGRLVRLEGEQVVEHVAAVGGDRRAGPGVLGGFGVHDG
jgi:hypothetical protein